MSAAKCIVLTLLAAVGLTACTYDYTKSMVTSAYDATGLSHNVRVSRYYNWRLSPETALWIAVPNTELSPREGFEISQLIYTELRKKFPLSQSASLAASIESSLVQARVKGKPITIYPYIYHYENNLSSPTEFGQNFDDRNAIGRDHIGITLHAYNSYTGELIDVAELRASSKPVDFSMGNIDTLLSLLAANYGEELVAVAP